MVGKLLTELGYNHIDGSDFSPDMLEQAKDTGCYRALQKSDYSEAIEIPDSSYDSTISIGVYTKRFKQNFLREMLRITRPGGYLLFSCRPVYFAEIAEQVLQLHVDDTIDVSTVRKDDYMVGQRAVAYYISLQKAAN